MRAAPATSDAPTVSPLRRSIEAELADAERELPAAQGKLNELQEAQRAADAELRAFNGKFKLLEERLAQQQKMLAAPLLRHRDELKRSLAAASQASALAIRALYLAHARLRGARDAQAQLAAIGE